MRLSGRWLVALGAASVAVTVVAGAVLYRSAHGSSRPGATTASAVPLPVIWRRAETWPSPVRATVRAGALRLRDLHGYRVVLNFFASWCDPCRREAALLRRAAARTRARIVFVGAAVNDYTPDAKRFLRAHQIPYVVVQTNGAIVKEFGLIGLPETFYLGPGGRIVTATRGELTARELARALRILAKS